MGIGTICIHIYIYIYKYIYNVVRRLVTPPPAMVTKRKPFADFWNIDYFKAVCFANMRIGFGDAVMG